MSDNDFPSREIDASRPSAARMYRYYLSGQAGYDTDRTFGERVRELFPEATAIARHNREFLGRAVDFMARNGIGQFLDIGAGLPAAGSTHEVARRRAPAARVVYVDNDTEAVSLGQDLLRAAGALDITAVIDADLRCPDDIFDHSETRRLIDPDQPVGLLIVSVWPFVPDSDRPYRLMAQLRDRLPRGSYVAMSHASQDEASADVARGMTAATELYKETSDPVTLRRRDDFAAFYDGLELLDPGIVHAPEWRPTAPVDMEDPARPCNFAAVGYKP
ncbi:putative S-adenosyl-L-methionine dependent methyltransferase [Nocardia nova SH22a]|uniref:Putative S-adenosyl-L-methionine dependent methyltransferase n=1 Tax=Nocardia nova SH22a TaxID=1415166 RepID=W5TMC9_9NOCA|nr:SAM-dependent methyltransferase [Nocardia nova]AHH20153.1 putative S-adenosyl-L-methionine dependent methyltransferase [Nocardia nova SH22a]